MLFSLECAPMAVISFVYQDDTLVNIILNCPTWIEIQRYFTWTYPRPHYCPLPDISVVSKATQINHISKN